MLRFSSRGRRDREWRKQRREFVYLDEVSVTSLIAARDGSIAESVKDTLTRASESESKVTMGLPFKSVKLGTESRVRASDSSSREVVRRTVIQGTFRNLRIGDKDMLLIDKSERSRPARLSRVGTTGELKRSARKLRKHGSLLPVDAINRGDVLELEVTLDADKAYRLVSAVSSIMEIVRGREALFGIEDDGYENVVSSVEVIDRLLIGLVPVRGTSTQFRVLKIDDIEYLVDKMILEPGSQLAAESLPLELVGVTEFTSYWKDLRRVLYSGMSYTAYVRVESPELQDGWNPVKLADVMRAVSIDVSTLMSELPDSFEDAQNSDTSRELPLPGLTEIFVEFGQRVAGAFDADIDPGVLQDAAGRGAATFITDPEDVDIRRHSFEIVVEAITPVPEAPADREIIRGFREEAYSAIAALESGGHNNSRNQGEGSREDGRKLEVEFVAIYW